MPSAKFKDELLAEIGNLRAFAISLSGSVSVADDLVQESLLRAWANSEKFQPGTSLRAWLFTILRNIYYSNYRKRSREVQDSDGLYARRLYDSRRPGKPPRSRGLPQRPDQAAGGAARSVDADRRERPLGMKKPQSCARWGSAQSRAASAAPAPSWSNSCNLTMRLNRPPNERFARASVGSFVGRARAPSCSSGLTPADVKTPASRAPDNPSIPLGSVRHAASRYEE